MTVTVTEPTVQTDGTYRDQIVAVSRRSAAGACSTTDLLPFNSQAPPLRRAEVATRCRSYRQIKPARRGRIHTFISTSPVHMKWKLQMTPEQVYELVVAQVTRARNHTEDVEWSPEDATRTDPDFMAEA